MPFGALIGPGGKVIQKKLQSYWNNDVINEDQLQR
jgi:hypothetical protein